MKFSKTLFALGASGLITALSLPALSAFAVAVPQVQVPTTPYSNEQGRVLRDISSGGVVIQAGQNIPLGATTPTGQPGSASQPVPRFSAINSSLWISQNGPAQIGDDLLIYGIADFRMGMANTSATNNRQNSLIIHDNLEINGDSDEAGNVTINGALVANGKGPVNANQPRGTHMSAIYGGLQIHKPINQGNAAAISTNGGILVNDGYLAVRGGDLTVRGQDVLVTDGGGINVEGNLEVGTNGSSQHQFIGGVRIISGLLRTDGDVTMNGGDLSLTSGNITSTSGNLSVGDSANGGNITLGRVSNSGNARTNVISMYAGDILMRTVNGIRVEGGALSAENIGTFYSIRGGASPTLPRGTSTEWSEPESVSCTAGDKLISCDTAFAGNNPPSNGLWYIYPVDGNNTCTLLVKRIAAVAGNFTAFPRATCFSPDIPRQQQQQR